MELVKLTSHLAVENPGIVLVCMLSYFLNQISEQFYLTCKSVNFVFC